MKTTHRIVLLTGVLFMAGCASNPSSVQGTDGLDLSAGENTVIDRDGDGVPDSMDQCDDTASRALVDDSGCEVVMGVVDGLSFASGQSQLSESAMEVLDRYVSAFKRYPDAVVRVEAHTDNRGTAADNLELSKQRVLAVVEYMVDNGISPQRLKPFGYGESSPMAANATAEGREQNRRIEIKVVEGLL